MKPFEYDEIEWVNGSYTIERPRVIKELFVPQAHQEEVWEWMDERFPEYHGGVIWVPTGGGKTVIAAKWLLLNVLANNDRVLWLADNDLLLRQAAKTFRNLINRLPELKTGLRIKMAYICGDKKNKATSWERYPQDANIVFTTWQSSTRYAQKVKEFCSATNEYTFIVMDEVHHAAATTYIGLLKKIDEYLSEESDNFDSGNIRLLGMSATPYRLEGTKELWKLFTDKKNPSPIEDEDYKRISQNELIFDKVLANPIFEIRRTNVALQFKLGDEGDIPQLALDDLGNHEVRNQFIVKTYLEDYLKYGKTIIFTPSKESNIKLKEEFQRVIQERGYQNEIRVDYVDSARSKKENDTTIIEFREPRPSSVRVLINVEMCTEGFDAPVTKTVFLARPTNSDSLVRQMMGRAFRGIKSNGNEECNIVTFVDRLPPGFHLQVPEAIFEAEKGKDIYIADRLTFLDPRIRKLYDTEFSYYSFLPHCTLKYHYQYIPAGWFLFETPLNGDGITHGSESDDLKAPVSQHYFIYLSHQERGYTRMTEEIMKNPVKKRVIPGVYEEIINKFFYDCPDPLPSPGNLTHLVRIMEKSLDHDSNWQKIPYSKREQFNPDFIQKTLDKGELKRPNDEKKFIKMFYRGTEEWLYSEIERAGWYAYNREICKFSERDQRILSSFSDRHSIISKERVKEIFDEINKANPGLNWQNKMFKFICFKEEDRSPLAFCRFNNDEIELHLSSLLFKKGFFRIIFEYILYHECIHAIVPFDHHGPIFTDLEEKFMPSNEAHEELSSFKSWSKLELKPPEVFWSAFCRGYLNLFINSKNYKKSAGVTIDELM